MVRVRLPAPRALSISGIGNRLIIGRQLVRIQQGPPTGVSIMDNTEDFYSFNVGSIPTRRTKYIMEQLWQLM